MTPGTLIDGRFLVERKAGAGGMGTVYRAVDQRRGAPVALKVLHGEDEVDVERLVREAAILAELDHPNIVRYAAHGVTETGEHYLAMEWLDGEDLGTRLGRRPLTDAETLAVVRQAAIAVSFAHARGAVHRDLKPSNLFLRGGDVGRVAVVDFGLAGLAGHPQRLTQTGVLLGTPGYVAPEQVQGRSSRDPRSDIFSLGCVLFECLAGRPAFEGMNPMAVLAKLLLQESPRLRDARPAIPPPLDALVSRMLAKDPESRPQSLAEVVAEIDAITAVSALSTGPPSVTDAPPAATLVSTPEGSAECGATLTRDEHRLVSVLLAGHEVLPASVEIALAAAVAPHGGQVSVLGGGLLIVSVWAPGTAVDRAERAAACAGAVRERFPEIPMALVTGRGQIAARVVEGDLLDRGVRALAATRPGAMSVDEATAGMLASRLPRDEPAWVGRGRELAMLEGIFDGCVAERVATAVLVTGPAGSGKSHLRRALLDRLQRRGAPLEILVGRAGALADGAPLGAFADVVRGAAGIRPGDPVEACRSRLAARVQRRLPGSGAAHVAAFLGELAGVPAPDPSAGAQADFADAVLFSARHSPALMAEGIRAAWEEWLLAECSAGPVLLVLEDLHWADAASLRLVESTLRNLRELPLMILALARPDAPIDVRATWVQRDLPIIRLGSLSTRASVELARDLLGEGADAAVVDRLVERSSGNPLFLVELARAAAAGHPEAPPEAVLGLVEARLDAEGADARRILRAASVYGDRFTAAGVAALLGSSADDVRRALQVLAARELVARIGEPGPDVEHRFCHALVREAAYATLTEPDRALGHRLARAFLAGAGVPGRE